MMTKDHKEYKERKGIGREKRRKNVEIVIEGMNLMPHTIARLMLPFQSKYERKKSG